MNEIGTIFLILAFVYWLGVKFCDKKIKEIDPSSFVIVTTSSEIIGRGFRNV